MHYLDIQVDDKHITLIDSNKSKKLFEKTEIKEVLFTYNWSTQINRAVNITIIPKKESELFLRGLDNRIVRRAYTELEKYRYPVNPGEENATDDGRSEDEVPITKKEVLEEIELDMWGNKVMIYVTIGILLMISLIVATTYLVY